jgi:adenylate cyclase
VWGSILSFILVLIIITAGLVLFARYNLVLELSTPILLVTFSFIGHNLHQYILTQKEKRMIQGAFTHYVPKKVVAEILKNPDQLKLGGEEREVTVLFSDIAGFTTISEQLEPSQLVHLLNEYLTEMSEIILTNEGIIDKYEGDAIMAEFGVPVHFEDHAVLACRTALEMQKRLSRLRDKWKTENQPQLSARIGINTGEVIVGNLGSRDVFDYTVLGDAVNLGSRLEGVNKVYGTQIMISEFTHEIIQDYFISRMIDIIQVKGKTEAIRVYELIAEKDEQPDEKILEILNQFQDGIAHYQKQKWDAGLACFKNCIELNDKDMPSQIYIERCQSFKINPPDPDWNGVTVLDEK